MDKKIIELIKEIHDSHRRHFHLGVLMKNPDFNMFIAAFFSVTGFLPFYVLYLLRRKDYYGQEIIKTISTNVDNIWVPNPGIVYPLLKNLKSSGLISGHWYTKEKHPRYIYSITEKGKEEYKKMYEIVKIKLSEGKKVIEKIEKEVFENG